MKRTNYCASLTEKNINKKVVLYGWVHSWRNHGGVLFVDLRDRTGIVQITAGPSKKEVFETAETVRNEYVIKVEGTVKKRPEGYINKNLPTGNIEVHADEIEILNTCKDLPLEIDEHYNVTEETRLKYRYIDLRKPRMTANLTLRHKVGQAVRNFFDKEGFLEIETPILTRSTPEGARDYLVPSRVNKGKFYALPQSPQMFKQILMVSGVDKYFQLARAYRDEDLRADRQPEHTQIDIEMSFVEQSDIFKLIEKLMKEVFKVIGEKISPPFIRIDYDDVMRKYGTDKPDLRYDLELKDCTKTFKETKFKIFADNLKAGNVIYALKGQGGSKFSRGDIDKLTETVKKHKAKGLVWLKVKENKQYESPAAKFFTAKELGELVKLTDAKEGDIIFLGSDKENTAAGFMGALRVELIKKLQLKPNKKWAFLWVKNFPLLEWDEENKIYISPHNPFTAPLKEDEKLLDSDAAKVKSYQYDLVLNGVELASGSIRNHKRKLQEKIFKLMGYTPQDMQHRFGMLLNALDYGTPPHGGIAMGFDRLIAILKGEESIREVIAFPKTATAVCPLSGAPDTVDENQLKELGLKLIN
jgi:aspartyl-tRNA synthetase